MFNGLQVVVMVLSSDQENDGDLLGVLGVSAALSISDIPFSGANWVCRIGRIEGQFIINPTISQLSKSDIEIVVSGTKNAIIMVEGCTKEISEDEMVNILSLGHTELKKTIVLQEELMKKCETKRNTGSAKVKQTVELFKVDEILNTTVSKFFNEKITGIGEISDKNKWLVKIDAAKKETLSHFSVEFKDQEGSMRYVMEETLRHVIRQSILEKGVRPDGRKYNEIREISCEIGVLPRTHGSALFSRGQTQALVITTLGTDDDAQIIDDLEGESKKRYMLQYNFPPFSVGEARANARSRP